VKLLQYFIPKKKKHATQPGSAPQAKVNNAADEAAMKSEAEKIHRMVLAGGDFEMLQDEAYEIAGDPDGAPDTDMGTLTRSQLGKFQKEIFALQPGQTSELIEGPEAWHIFTVVSKKMGQEDARKFLNAAREGSDRVAPEFCQTTVQWRVLWAGRGLKRSAARRRRDPVSSGNSGREHAACMDRNRTHSLVFCCLLLAIGTAALYSPVLHHPF
jgi:hypothetical protein